MKNFILFVFAIHLSLVVLAISNEPKLEWVAYYEGPGNNGGYPVALTVDNAGNVYVTGTSQAAGENSIADGGEDYATVKYDSNGKELWVARYDGGLGDSGTYHNGCDEAHDIAVDQSGNSYVTGSSRCNIETEGESYFRGVGYATIKYNSNGKQIWVKRYDGNGPAGEIDLDNYGNIYVTGAGGMIKYTPDGNQVWLAKDSGCVQAMDES